MWVPTAGLPVGEPVYCWDPLTSGGPFVLELSEVSISMFVKGIFILDAARRVGHLMYRRLGNLAEHCWLNLFLSISAGRLESQDGEIKDNSWVCAEKEAC